MSTLLITLARPDGTGAHRMAVHFARALREADHRVIVIQGDDDATDHQRRRAPLGLTRSLREAGVEVRVEAGLERVWDPTVARRLARAIRTEGATAIVGVNQADRKFALWASARTGIRCVICAQSRHRFYGPPLVRRLKEIAYRRLLRSGADLVVCPSDAIRDEIVHRFRVPEGRCRLLPNAIDVVGFPVYGRDRVRDVRGDLGVREDDLLLVNVGRLDEQKGQDLLLQAFARVAPGFPTAKLALAGPKPRGRQYDRMRYYLDRLTDLSEAPDLRGRVVFAGWCDDVPRLLGASDGYVHSARWEGPALNLSVLEAMAAGRPTILTDCSGRPEGFVDGTHGQVVRTGDVEALARAMERLLSLDDEARAAMGTAGRTLALARYDIATVGRRFVELVEQTLGSGPPEGTP